MIVDTVMRVGEANPNDIVLYDPLVPVNAFVNVQDTTVMMFANETEAFAVAHVNDIVLTKIVQATYGPGTYPAPGDVDLGAAKYGPTGIEYQGTLLQPIPANVKSGIKYGAGGVEYTGTLSGGGGLTPGTLLIDPLTGDRFIYLSDTLIIRVELT